MPEGLVEILFWAGLFVVVALLLVGVVLGALFLGMRHYYPDEHPRDSESSSRAKRVKTKP